jgi:hypothetical protein
VERHQGLLSLGTRHRFFGFSDLVLGHAAPTSAALEAEARTVLGRLP